MNKPHIRFSASGLNYGQLNNQVGTLLKQKETCYCDCSGGLRTYGAQLVSEIISRTETAMSQAHCLLAPALALRAPRQAQRLRPGGEK